VPALNAARATIGHPADTAVLAPARAGEVAVLGEESEQLCGKSVIAAFAWDRVSDRFYALAADLW
jgi:hypothetical protein